MVNNLPAKAGDTRRWFDPWVGKIPWNRKWQLTPVFLPGKAPGQRSKVGYSPWGCKESDTTEHTHTQGDLGLICVTVGIVQTRGQTAELTASNINEKSLLLLPNRL